MKNEFLLDPRPVGEQIADRCKSVDITVSELCRRTGVQPYQVSHWKKHDPAGVNGLRKIEKELQKLEHELQQLDKKQSSCDRPCSPSDYYKGGYCDRHGCYTNEPPKE